MNYNEFRSNYLWGNGGLAKKAHEDKRTPFAYMHRYLRNLQLLERNFLLDASDKFNVVVWSRKLDKLLELDKPKHIEVIEIRKCIAKSLKFVRRTQRILSK